jgi:hypothetical protein
MTQTYQVRDGARIMAFDGVCIAKVSSRRPSSPRWTELELYRTDTGKYVLAKIGRSVVVHAPGCPRLFGHLPKFVEEHPDQVPENGFEYDECVPEEYDFNTLLVEQTRFWALVADAASAIVNELHTVKGGVRVLPRMAVNLLEAAALIDGQIADAFYIEHVV